MVDQLRQQTLRAVKVLENIQDMVGVVADLLEEVAVNDIVRAAIDSCYEESRVYGVDVSLDLDRSEPDVSCDPLPPLASLLFIQQPPPDGGGDTMFANMCEAYHALSTPLKKWLVGRMAEHDGRKDLAAYNVRLNPGQTYPRAEHPIVTQHPQTNEPILFVNGSFTSRLVGLSKAESDAMLDMLCAHTESNPRWQCRVRWSANTLVMWDNRCTQHHAVWDYHPNRRLARRVTVQCAEPPMAYS